ncbi:MAG: flavodoxin reductase [Flavobacteriaceae bacterium]|nr:flavodoxin reductase [Flavobacteriaceae bacterium]|tara:strand:+ start:16725 stop:17753 length:1029 start_codon:yes stop_codon:yes gene_type:complete
MSEFHLLKISKLELLTKKAIAVSFEIPYQLMDRFSFISGQYLTIELEIKGKTIRRSYSICSNQDETLRIAIKKVEGGLFSSYALENFNLGDKIKVGEPEGRFIFKPGDKKETITGIAAGSGITPILSIAKSCLSNNNKFRLIYGNKSPSETMFFNEVNELKEKYGNKFDLIWVYSEARKENSYYGRIDAEIINYYFNNYTIANKYFLCGPKDMIDVVLNQLSKNGVSTENIFFELFTTSNSNLKVEKKSTITDLEIIYDGMTYLVKNIGGKKLLDAALEENIDVPYSCQGGVCSSCLARIIKGKATMENNQILTDQEIKDGFILTCQAISKESYIKIDFDDI